ncbi:MAG: hypothetical protein GOV01_00265 [Candidatus Altiarchaeota archaeon]|nr:hypothetical protein [Candidatus Altiarchaeota archaeon]
MENIKIGLDLDRVIFDTNAYIAHLDSKLSKDDLSVKKVFQGNYGRKDIGVLHRELSKSFGQEEVTRMLFTDIEKFISSEVRGIADFIVASGGEVFVITVGDEYQREKIAKFPRTRIMTVNSDYDKIEMAAEMKLNLFVDDKSSVIKELRARKMKAFQATWFLDDERKKTTMKDALSTPSDLGHTVVSLLNDSE